jgi:hypothetical protein
MPKINYYSKAIFILSLFSVHFSMASKCMPSGTMSELKGRHDILIRAMTVERNPLKEQNGSFELTFSVIEVVKGKFKESIVKGREYHRVGPLPVKREYMLRQVYLLPVRFLQPEKKPYVETQPDGCPEFLAEKIKPTTRNYAATSVLL